MYKKKKVAYIVIGLFISQCLLTACSSGFDNVSENKHEVQELLQSKLKVTSVDDALQKAEKAILNHNMELAQLYYIKAYELEPDNVQVLQKMANLYFEIKRYDLAEVAIKMILKQQPDDLNAIEQYGLLLIEQRKYIEAKENLGRVIAKQQSWRAYNGLGIIANLEDNPENAIIFFKKADSINPNSPELLNNIGFAYYSADKLNEAATYYIKALQINSSFEKAIYNYGLLQARLKNYEEAYIAFSKVADPAEANNNVGYIAMMNGDYAMADKYLKEAINLSPKFYKKAQDNLTQLKFLEKKAGSN